MIGAGNSAVGRAGRHGIDTADGILLALAQVVSVDAGHLHQHQVGAGKCAQEFEHTLGLLHFGFGLPRTGPVWHQGKRAQR
jgi:hypothetical protein